MNTLAFFSNLAGPDLLIILFLVLVLFGAKKLPGLARGMGQAVKEFQKAKDDFVGEIHTADQPRPVAPRDTVAASALRIEVASPASNPPPPVA